MLMSTRLGISSYIARVLCDMSLQAPERIQSYLLRLGVVFDIVM